MATPAVSESRLTPEKEQPMYLPLAIIIFILAAAVADHHYCFSCRAWRVDLRSRKRTVRFCPCCTDTRDWGGFLE